jgi:hypothetical protein
MNKLKIDMKYYEELYKKKVNNYTLEFKYEIENIIISMEIDYDNITSMTSDYMPTIVKYKYNYIITIYSYNLNKNKFDIFTKIKETFVDDIKNEHFINMLKNKLR